MIPEPVNKKGAFAPFDNRTLLIILIGYAPKITFQCAISASSCNPYNQGLSFRFIIFIGRREIFSPETSSHSEP